MVKKIWLALIVFSLIFLSGCLATKTEAECQDIRNQAFTETWRVGEASMCYQELAIGYALKGNAEAAVDACKEAGNTTNIVSAFAQANMNNCFSDIAAITHNKTICSYIETSLIEKPIGGVWNAYQEECEKKVTEYDYDLGMCWGFFAILLPLMAVFAARKKG